MVDKRFMIDFENRVITDTISNEDYSTLIQFKQLLNELNDENITLKKDNETLKIKNKNLIKISSYTQVKNDSLKKENEQLKKKVKTLEDTIEGLTGTIAHFDLEEVL